MAPSKTDLWTRPTLNGLGNFLAWVVSLWTLEVTADLITIVAVAAIVGGMNLILAYRDNKRAILAEAERDRVIKRLDGKLVDHKLPLAVQDLTALDDDIIRGLVADETWRLRQIHAAGGNIAFPDLPRDAPEETKDYIWRQNRQESIKAHQEAQSVIARECLPNLRALWAEIDRRFEKRGARARQSNQLKAGIVAAPDQLAFEIESYSQQL